MSPPVGNPFSGRGSEGANAGDTHIGHSPELARAVAQELPNARNLPVPTAADFTNPGALAMLNNGFQIYDPQGGSPSDAANWMSSKGQGAEAAAGVIGNVMGMFKDLGAGFASQDSAPPDDQQTNEYALAQKQNEEARQRELASYQQQGGTG